MRLLIPPWLRHGREADGGPKGRGGGALRAPARSPVFAVDLQPRGDRLATAGQDGAVHLWSVRVLSAAADGGAASAPPAGAKLASVTGHGAAVNCVRWSPCGTLFASGGDDAVVLVYERSADAGNDGRAAAFGGGAMEDWRVRRPMRAHEADVTDVCWSPDGERIASASVDNSIGIWAVRAGALVCLVTGHSGLVKGVAWDPVGRFLASQSDDRSVIVWRTSDWSQAHKLTAPFEGAVFASNANVFFQRLSWSPCGTQLLTTNGVGTPHADIAPMFARDAGFSKFIQLMGHKAPVVSTRFSPRLYRSRVAPSSAGAAGDENGHAAAPSKPSKSQKPYTCLAIGSKDGGITIWQAAARRPYIAMAEVFDQEVIDVSWGSDGYTLVACASDGEVAYIRFDPKELGDVVPLDEERKLLSELWRAFGGGAAAVTTVAETPAQLAALEQSTTPRPVPVQNGEKTPVAPVASIAKPPRAPTHSTPMKGGVRPTKLLANSVEPTPPADKNLMASQREGRARSGKRRIIPAAVTAPHPSEPVSLLSDSASSVYEVPETLPPPSLVGEFRDVGVRESSPKRPRVSAAGAMASAVNGVVTRGDGAAPGSPRPEINRVVISTDEHLGVYKPQRPPLYKPSVIGLNMVILAGETTAPVLCRAIDSCTPPTLLEAKEQLGSTRGGGYMLSCSVGGEVQWRDFYPASSAVVLLAGVAEKFATVGTADGLLLFYSAASGRRLMPPIMLDSAPHLIEAHVMHAPRAQNSGEELWYALVVSRSGLCSVYDVRAKKVVCSRSAASLLARPVDGRGESPDNEDATVRADVYRTITAGLVTENGEPLLVLSDSHAFFYSRDLCSWLRVADDSAPNSEFTRGPSSPVNGVGILRSLQARVARTRRAPNLSGMGDLRRSAVETLAHLENLLECAVSMSSASDYRYYLTNYASKLATASDDDVENADVRLRELCDSLLRVNATTRDECILLGMDTRALLKDVVLVIVSRRTSLQRLVSEYLELVDEKERRMKG